MDNRELKGSNSLIHPLSLPGNQGDGKRPKSSDDSLNSRAIGSFASASTVRCRPYSATSTVRSRPHSTTASVVSRAQSETDAFRRENDGGRKCQSGEDVSNFRSVTFRRVPVSFQLVLVPSCKSTEEKPCYRKVLMPMDDILPSPAEYCTDNWAKVKYKRMPTYHIIGKPKETHFVPTPSPDAYTLPGTVGLRNMYYARAPGYTMRIKTATFVPPQKDKKPEPGAYNLPDMNVYRVKDPAFSIPKAELMRTYPIKNRAQVPVGLEESMRRH